jgi:hypothetical protein
MDGCQDFSATSVGQTVHNTVDDEAWKASASHAGRQSHAVELGASQPLAKRGDGSETTAAEVTADVLAKRARRIRVSFHRKEPPYDRSIIRQADVE